MTNVSFLIKFFLIMTNKNTYSVTLYVLDAQVCLKDGGISMYPKNKGFDTKIV